MAKHQSLSDQIRAAIDASGESRYRLCLDCDINKAAMSRVMAGKGNFSMEAVDRLAKRLGWTLNYPIVEPTKTKSPRKKSKKGKE